MILPPLVPHPPVPIGGGAAEDRLVERRLVPHRIEHAPPQM